jgi:hypothetical protein
MRCRVRVAWCPSKIGQERIFIASLQKIKHSVEIFMPEIGLGLGEIV